MLARPTPFSCGARGKPPCWMAVPLPAETGWWTTSRRMGVESLDYVIASHPDSDHIGGLSQVLEELPQSAWSSIHGPRKCGRLTNTWRWKPPPVRTRVPVREVRAGDSLPFGGTALMCWDRWRNMRGPTTARWCCGWNIWVSALFCGDIEYEAEKDLVKSGAALDADLLKVAHHGSAGSSSQRFLEAVSPEYAVISVGPDNSNLPREETLRRPGIRGSCHLPHRHRRGSGVFLEWGTALPVERISQHFGKDKKCHETACN